MRKNNPGSRDGKPVGAPTNRIVTMADVVPSAKRWGREMRRRIHAGDEAARLRMVGHIQKWLSRGMPIERVAKRLGLPLAEAHALIRKPQEVGAPRLVKGARNGDE